MRIRLILLLILLFGANALFAQELNCQVDASSAQIQSSDKKVFDNLKKSIYEFINNKKWTNHIFKEEERIECSILINITSWDNSDYFQGTINVQSRRPVYNSAYNSVLFNYLDKDLSFKYIDMQPLEFSETSNTSNLTAVLAFYVYYILGLDYDTFAENGGSEYFQKSEVIVNNSQSDATYTGWKAFESTKNRYWLVNNMLDPAFSSLRQCNYQYHRLGLDKMSKDKEGARATITEAIMLLQKVYNEKPGSLSLQLFSNTKADEIVNIYSEGAVQDKNRVNELMRKIDPTNNTKWDAMMKTPN